MAGRLLLELKVAELRKELETRGKDKTGVKQVLLDRLKEVIHEEGHDPLSFRFGSEVEQQEESLETTSAIDEDTDPEKGTCELSKDSTEPCVVLSDVVEEPANQKKVADEAVPYVVQVGDQEEDLDYDLKNDNTVQDQDVIQTDSQEAEAHATTFGDMPESVKDSAADKLIGDNHCKTAEKRNLWVSNLPKTIKAADLKQHFSKAGKVVSATVVTRTRSPGGCFGFLQMCNADEATNAANQLNGTEIDGLKITVEATERKPLSLPSNKLTQSISQARTAYQPPIKRFGDRRALAGRVFNQRRIIGRNYANISTRNINDRSFDQERNIARRRIEEFSIPVRRVPIPRPGTLVHHYVKRATQLLNLSRYGIKRNLPSPVIEQSVHRFRRDLPRQNTRYSKIQEPMYIKRSVPKPTIPLRRLDDKPYLRDKRRLPVAVEERVRPVIIPPRRSEEAVRVNRNLPIRVPRQNSLSENYQTRGSYMSRNYNVYSRTVRNNSTVVENKRPLPIRPVVNRIYDRDDRLRMVSNESARGGLTNRSPYRYKSSYAVRQSEVRPSPGSRMYPTAKPAMACDVRREYRAISRSPPRSRNAFDRPYPEAPSDNRIFKHVSRDRSPLGYSASSSSVRPKVVDYGHRSEPRGSWSSWKMEQDSRHISPPAGHTWKPAGQAYPVSNYPRGPYRYS